MKKFVEIQGEMALAMAPFSVTCLFCSLPNAEPAHLRTVHFRHGHLPLPARHQTQHAHHRLDSAGLGTAVAEGQGVGRHCKLQSDLNFTPL